MKNSIVIVILFLITFFSCNNDDKIDSDADYSVLGVTALVINGEIVTATNEGVLETKELPFFVIDGALYDKAKKKAQLFYSVLADPKITPSVTLLSNYTDTDVTIDKEESTTILTYTITVRRAGYQEQLSYIIKFTPNIFLSD